MSCYEWEKGEIVLPSAQWAGFKKVIRDAAAAYQTTLLTLAEQCYTAITAAGNGQRAFNYHRAAGEWLERHRDVTSRMQLEIFDQLFPWKEQGSNKPAVQVSKPVKPLKKHYPQPTTKTVEFDCGDGHIRLDDKTRTFHWNVEENNHAVDHAHQHSVAIAAFRELDRLTTANLWTRNTGGTCWGSDEYRDEANKDDYGGTASDSQISKYYGPIGHERRAHSMGMSFTRYKSLKLDQPIRPTSRFRFGPPRRY